MKRQSHSAILSRLAAFALMIACAGIAAAPQAKGAGPTVAVTVFVNDAGAPPATIATLGDALYAAIDQSGKYTAVGGGPLKVKNATGGDLLVSALDVAQKVGAEEVITTDLISATGGSVTYRLSAYRVAPLAFIRSQSFTQSSLSPTALRAGFVTDLSALHAPRTAAGMIYSLTNGVKADFGEAYGTKLGDVYNVVRNSQKMAQAKVITVDINSATVEIFNAVAGYKPAIGDQLIGVGPQPAIPPVARTSVNTFSIIGILAATGAALWAIGHHGSPAGAAPAPSPTGTISSSFLVAPTNQSGSAPNETFTFTFNQPVDATTKGAILSANTTYLSFSQTRHGITVWPAGTPVTNLGGPAPTFSGGDTVLTISATALQLNDQLVFAFTNKIRSATTGQFLTPTNVTFTASGFHHPVPQSRGAIPVHGGVLNPAPGGVHKPQPPPGKDPKDPKNPK